MNAVREPLNPTLAARLRARCRRRHTPRRAVKHTLEDATFAAIGVVLTVLLLAAL